MQVNIDLSEFFQLIRVKNLSSIEIKNLSFKATDSKNTVRVDINPKKAVKEPENKTEVNKTSSRK